MPYYRTNWNEISKILSAYLVIEDGIKEKSYNFKINDPILDKLKNKPIPCVFNFYRINEKGEKIVHINGTTFHAFQRYKQIVNSYDIKVCRELSGSTHFSFTPVYNYQKRFMDRSNLNFLKYARENKWIPNQVT